MMVFNNAKERKEYFLSFVGCVIYQFKKWGGKRFDKLVGLKALDKGCNTHERFVWRYATLENFSKKNACVTLTIEFANEYIPDITPCNNCKNMGSGATIEYETKEDKLQCKYTSCKNHPTLLDYFEKG
jgi:hypothetical protein